MSKDDFWKWVALDMAMLMTLAAVCVHTYRASQVRVRASTASEPFARALEESLTLYEAVPPAEPDPAMEALCLYRRTVLPHKISYDSLIEWICTPSTPAGDAHLRVQLLRLAGSLAQGRAVYSIGEERPIQMTAQPVPVY